MYQVDWALILQMENLKVFGNDFVFDCPNRVHPIVRVFFFFLWREIGRNCDFWALLHIRLLSLSIHKRLFMGRISNPDSQGNSASNSAQWNSFTSSPRLHELLTFAFFPVSANSHFVLFPSMNCALSLWLHLSLLPNQFVHLFLYTYFSA